MARPKKMTMTRTTSPARRKRAIEAESQSVREMLDKAGECPKCHINAALCDCPDEPCECGHSKEAHFSVRTASQDESCKHCKCRTYRPARPPPTGRLPSIPRIELSAAGRLALARDLMGLMRNLWADETEKAVRAGQLAERQRIVARLRAMPEEVTPRCPPSARTAFLDAALTLEREDREGPRIWRASSREHGGCNFCHRHISARGGVDHAVTVVVSGHNGGVQVRFCDACLDALHAAMTTKR